MLVRVSLVVLGILELLWPRQVVDFWVDFAMKDDANPEAREWVYTAARLEGLALVLYAFSRWRKVHD